MDSNVGHNSQLHFGSPADWYHQPDNFERERQRIFRCDWKWIGRLDQLTNPGDYIATDIAGWRVFVMRDRDGDLRAFHNVCRHRAAVLVDDGAGRCDVPRCRCHGWVYDAIGRLRQTPHFGDSPRFDKAGYSLYSARVDVWRGLVFVNLDPETPPLTERLGALLGEAAPYPIEDYKFAREEVFDLNCNWKTYTDNFVEGYHVPGIHQSFAAVIDFDRFMIVGRNRTVIMRAPRKDGSFYGGVWLWRYPNTTMSFFPDGMNMSRIMPLARNRTRLVYNFFFHDTSPAAMARNNETIARNCGVVREDSASARSPRAIWRPDCSIAAPSAPAMRMASATFTELVRQSLGGARRPAFDFASRRRAAYPFPKRQPKTAQYLVSQY